MEKKDWKYKDREMILKFQKNYLEDKRKELEEKKKNKGSGKGGNKDKKAEEKEPVKEEDDFKMPKGAVLKLTGLGGDITREDIKDVLKKKYEVKGDIMKPFHCSEVEDCSWKSKDVQVDVMVSLLITHASMSSMLHFFSVLL